MYYDSIDKMLDVVDVGSLLTSTASNINNIQHQQHPFKAAN